MASVDHFSSRIRRVQTDMEFLQLSILYQQFFNSEIEMLCLQPEYWQKVSILYCGASGFALYEAGMRWSDSRPKRSGFSIPLQKRI